MGMETLSSFENLLIDMRMGCCSLHSFLFSYKSQTHDSLFDSSPSPPFLSSLQAGLIGLRALLWGLRR
jgi:hypothetical protein